MVFRRAGVLNARDPTMKCIFVKDCSVFEAFTKLITYVEPYCTIAE